MKRIPLLSLVCVITLLLFAGQAAAAPEIPEASDFMPVLAADSTPEPETLAPYDLKAELLPQDETHPYGSVRLTFQIDGFPRSSETHHWYVLIEKKIGLNDWKEVDEPDSDSLLDNFQTSPGVFEIEQLWVEDYEWKTDISISFRASVVLYDYTFSAVGSSAHSNIASIGLKGSSWAIPELEKAMGCGLIPVSLSGKDLTQPITREEFCEVALLLYENTTGKQATPVSPNPFTDTANPQILKAFELGITTGTSKTTFSPNELINREQCATMLSRTIRVMVPDGDFSTTGAPTFNDQKDISSWAMDHVMYMSKLGIIKGSNGNFMPKAVTDAQKAAGYATTTREQAIAMGVRIHDQYEAIKKTAGSGSQPGETSADIPADFNGTWSITYKYTGEKHTMKITQSGNTITGVVIDNNPESITVEDGMVTGNVLTMKMTSKTDPNWRFDVVYTMSEDQKSFTGTWKYPGYTFELDGMKNS